MLFLEPRREPKEDEGWEEAGTWGAVPADPWHETLLLQVGTSISFMQQMQKRKMWSDSLIWLVKYLCAVFEENQSLGSVRFLQLSQIRLEVRADWGEMVLSSDHQRDESTAGLSHEVLSQNLQLLTPLDANCFDLSVGLIFSDLP